MAAMFMESTRKQKKPDEAAPKKPDLKPYKGQQQFFVDGKEVWAINEKNAIRKARSIKQ